METEEVFAKEGGASVKEESLQALMEAGIPYRQNEPLAPHSSFRIGGKAELAVFPQSEKELLRALSVLQGEDPTVVGRGSNLVFPDQGLSRPVIFTEGLKSLVVSGKEITADAGVSLIALCRAAEEASLCGLAFAYGIPGSVGGGIYMNAGAFGGELGSLCKEIRYYDGEHIQTLAGTEGEFSYRKSFFTSRKNCVILSAAFLLSSGDREAIASSMKEFLERRKSRQPLEYPSAGSVFKRPEGHYAGALIEACGLKGCSIGGAQVSEKHAGFIVNRGGATAADVKALVTKIQETVFAKTGVLLESEIEFL